MKKEATNFEKMLSGPQKLKKKFKSYVRKVPLFGLKNKKGFIFLTRFSKEVYKICLFIYNLIITIKEILIMLLKRMAFV